MKKLLILSLLLLSFVLLYGSAIPVQAQDNSLYVCRDVNYGPLRFEFRNIPPAYFTYSSDAHWGYWAGGVSFDLENFVIIADPLEEDTDGHAINTVYLVDYDTGLELVGDENSPPCVQKTSLDTILPDTRVKTPSSQPNAISEAIYSTGRICTVSYPSLVIVCNGV